MDQRIAARAARQFGVISLAQLVALGLNAPAVRARVASGRLHRIHRGVYAVGHARLTSNGYRMAAVLACGPGSVISHLTAADELGIRPSASAKIHVTSPRRCRKRMENVVVHVARNLNNDDVTTTEDGTPITTVARTIVDLADTLSAHRLERVISRATRQQVFDLRALETAMARANGRRGIPTISKALKLRDPGQTRSDAEDVLLELLRGAPDLPHYLLNASVDVGNPIPLEVDVLFPEQKLVVELDSRAYHHNPESFETDRKKSAALAAVGVLTVPVTDSRLAREPAAVIDQLRRILRTRTPPA